MRSQIKLGRVFGIRIGVHYSWLLIAFLVVISLYGQFRTTHPGWPVSGTLAGAIAAGILFFASLLLHELAHSLVAKSQGIPVREITLFALGGVSQIERGSTTAKTEFWIAFVGPLTSASLGLICRALSRTAALQSEPLGEVLGWLGYINLVLAIFNMVPGYPLDGGRVLRAAIWWGTGSIYRATRWAARIGQVVAVTIIALGIFEFSTLDAVGGLWTAFIGWFLLMAAAESARETGLNGSLGGVSVGDVMSPGCQTINGNVTVQDFVDYELLRTWGRCFVVVDSKNGVIGLVTPHDLQGVPRGRWTTTTLRDIMRPLHDLQTVGPETPLMAAVELMGGHDLNQLPVVSHGDLAGIISRSELLKYLRTHAELSQA